MIALDILTLFEGLKTFALLNLILIQSWRKNFHTQKIKSIMDNSREVRQNREKIRQSLKEKMANNKKLIASREVKISFPEQTKEEPEVENVRTRRKTSIDIRQFQNSFDMFECSQILISTGFESLYEIVRKIDEGTQSVVHECREKQTGSIYAVKVMRTRDSDMQKSLKQQFRLLKNLSHDNIIKAYNLFMNEKTGVSHLVTDYCPYENLRVFLNKQRISTENEAAQIINSLLKVVVYLHSKGICHRDIKPENILYDPKTGDLKLIDFQISKMVKYEHQKLEMWTKTGTLQYKAPEMFKGMYTSMVDIWAVGVICYELLTGEFPFYNLFATENIRQILQDQPKYQFSDITDCCLNFLKKCLHKDPLKRFDASEALKSPYMLRYSSISSGSSPKHKRNGSEGTRRGSYEIQMIKCFDEDSSLSNRGSLSIDGGIRLVVDFKESEKKQP